MQKEKKGKWRSCKKLFYTSVIVLNILWILLLLGYYTFRLVHYYQLEHQTEAKDHLLVNQLLLDKNIKVQGDGLYESNDGYVFKGKDVNNYVSYSGFLFRIVGVTADKKIKLITDDTITNLAYGLATYEKSHLRTWLNPIEGQAHSGIFYQQLNAPANYLVKNKFCYSKVDDIKNENCNDYVTDQIGLLTFQDFKNARGKNSYLNNHTNYFITAVDHQNQAWYITSKGELSNQSATGDVLYSYGVRPVLYFNSQVKLVSGDGSKQKPYQIEQSQPTKLKDVAVGSYLHFCDYNWRVISKETGKIKVAMDGTLNGVRTFDSMNILYDPNSRTNIGYYLNHEFYQSLKDQTSMVTGSFYTGEYNHTNNYNYLRTFDRSVTAYVGLPQVGELFFHEYDNTFTLTPASSEAETIFTITNQNLFADLLSSKKQVRPVIYLKDQLTITGTGGKDDPYKVGEV